MMIILECKKSGLTCDISFRGFMEFRNDIAFLCDQEYGGHYAKLSDTIFVTSDTEDGLAKWQQTFDILRKKKNISSKIHHFLLLPDCDGCISKAACIELLFLTQKLPDKYYGVIGRNCRKTQIELVLLECISSNSSLVWY